MILSCDHEPMNIETMLREPFAMNAKGVEAGDTRAWSGIASGRGKAPGSATSVDGFRPKKRRKTQGESEQTEGPRLRSVAGN